MIILMLEFNTVGHRVIETKISLKPGYARPLGLIFSAAMPKAKNQSLWLSGLNIYFSLKVLI